MIFISNYDHLKAVAEGALSQYDLEVKRVDFLTEETNVYFKVETEDGTKYALKIYHEGSSTLEDNRAEIYFINQLKEIHTPHAMLNKDGEGITLVINDETSAPARIALYTWLEGEEHYGRESLETFRKIGKQAALMHKQTAELEIPADIIIKKWDQVFYYTDEEAVYMKPEYRNIVDEEDCKLLDQLVPILNDKLSALYSDKKPQLLHGDLNPWNVKFDKNGDIRIFDFEDSLLGFPIHELSIVLYFYRHVDQFDYEGAKDALIKGYQEIFPEAEFSDETLELLILAREITFMNYSLLFDEPPKEYATICLKRIKDCLAADTLNLFST